MSVGVRNKKRGQALGCLVLGLGLVLAGCGSSDDSGSGGSSGSTTSASPSADASDGAPSDGATSKMPSDSKSPLKLKAVSSNHGPTVLVSASQGKGTTSLRGKLIIAERGCMHVTNRSGPPTLLVFPPKTKIDAKRKPTVVLDSGRHPVGTVLDLKGEKVKFNANQAKQAKPCVARGDVFQITSVS